jgi:AAA family ATP:ADP antiporter
MGAKALIDTAVYRAGDVLGAWAYGLFALIPGPFGAAVFIVPLTCAWTMLNVRLGRAALHASKGQSQRNNVDS